MLLTIKRYRRIHKKKHFLKKLVDVYASPWAKVRAVFREPEAALKERRLLNSMARFESDRKTIIQNSLKIAGVTQISDVPELLQSASWVNYFATLLAQPAMPVGTLSAMLEPYVDNSKVLVSKADFNAVIVQLLHVVLSQMTEEHLTLHRYDYNYLDDMVAIVKSRYIGENGTAIDSCGQIFLNVLWLLCGKAETPFQPEQFPDALKKMLEDDHVYVPKTAYQKDAFEQSTYAVHKTELHELERIRGEEEPERVIQLWTTMFENINDEATDKYEERDISLIYGYENNHHLLLRSIVSLKAEGKLSAEDDVLIIGPRYADEVLFFRHALGFHKTIGLDLRTEGDVMVAGDMHKMLFENNRFKLIYGANVFEYAYDLRRVIQEIARVSQRPGYFAGIFRSTRTVATLLPCGSDVGTVEGATNLFYQYPHTVLAQDPGLTPNAKDVGIFPSVLIRFDDAESL